jgi:hypothetical protein
MIDHCTSSAPTLTMISFAWVARSAWSSCTGANEPLFSTCALSSPFEIVALLHDRLSTVQSFTADRSLE